MRRLAYLIISAVSGFSILALEFAAVRQMAPAFGQSAYVWANVIGVILVTLTIGYAVGGRLAERSSSGRPLFAAYGIVALWSVGAAYFGPAFCEGLIPTGLPTEGGLPLSFTGSLLASLVLFGPPTLLLAMTSPFLIRLEAKRGLEGRATGGIYAAGTLGSLAGCTIAPLWMLQVLGTRTTILVCAALIGTLCVLGLLSTMVRREDAGGPQAEPVTGAFRTAPRYLVLAGVTGWAVTLIEFGAVRFMSPWFGQSNHVWANVIGLILLALALGSWVGGRWADAAVAHGTHATRSFFGALAVASLGVTFAALIGPWILGVLMPDGIDSLRVLPVAHQGSKAASLLLFGMPMVLLGVVPPFLVRMAAGSEGHAGRAAGAIFAWTTVGGLVGCFTTGGMLVPLLGSRGALLLGALALAVLAVVFMPARAGETRSRRGVAMSLSLVAGVLALGLLGWQVGTRPVLREHPGQLVEIESGYQTIRVVRQKLFMGAPGPEETIYPAWLPAGAEASTLFLRHDEDAETYQSALIEDEIKQNAWMTGGRYFEHMAVGAFFAPPQPTAAPNPNQPLRILIIGYAGGTVHRTIRQTYPGDLDVLGVEIDPAVVDIARDHLRHKDLETSREGRKDRLRIVTGEDARTVVNALPADEMFDLILVDAYARTNYVPFQLATKEFFDRASKHLRPHGWIGVNVLGHGFRGPVAKAVAHTMDHVYGGCWAAPNPAYPGNVILWSQPGATLSPRLWSRAAIKAMGDWHPATAYAAFSIERYIVRYNEEYDGGILLTDDRSPSDRLADEELGL